MGIVRQERKIRFLGERALFFILENVCAIVLKSEESNQKRYI